MEQYIMGVEKRNETQVRWTRLNETPLPPAHMITSSLASDDFPDKFPPRLLWSDEARLFMDTFPFLGVPLVLWVRTEVINEHQSVDYIRHRY